MKMNIAMAHRPLTHHRHRAHFMLFENGGGKV
jgi:hypothetical protein